MKNKWHDVPDSMRIKFEHLFGINLQRFFNGVYGFELIDFDEWLKVPDGESISEFLIRAHGQEAHELVKGLLSI